MAGAGYKLFNTGDVLTAQQVNEYLQQQTVMVFANSTARTTALSGVIAEGMMSYLQDTNSVEYYNGSAWIAVAADQTPLTTKGDLFTFTTTDARLPVGTNGQYLSANSATSTGLEWVTPAASGGMTLISTTTLSGASVVLSSIPQTYKQLQLIIRNYLPVNSNALLRMRYNGSTTNQYNSNDLGVSQGNATFGISYAMIGQDGNSNTVSQQFSWVNIPDYTNTTTWKYNTAFAIANNSTTTTNVQIGSYYGIWNQTSAITSITLSPASGNFTSGTVLLYGVA